MGIYSLENYEKYKTKTIRFKPQGKIPSNFGRGQIHYVKLPWASIEPDRGKFNLELINRELENVKNPVLVLVPEVPGWVKNYVPDSFAAFVRRVGSFMGGDRKLAGVVISTIYNSRTEWNGYIDSFDRTAIFADLENKELISYLKDNNMDFGLLVKCSEKNWIECCEGFAEQNLQHLWKKNPVLVHITDDVCGPAIGREIYRWHGGLSNKQLDLGYNISLRRVTYPEAVSSKGALPLRLWLVNMGTAKIYQPFKIKLRIKPQELQQPGDEDISYELTLQGSTESWPAGDITHNEVLHLPDMESGTYTISIGLFLLDNTPIQLNNEKISLKGFYEIGTVSIDNKKRDELFNIWDTYYPEGYYPLEDPQTPEEE
jgi:hypothetical protein